MIEIHDTPPEWTLKVILMDSGYRVAYGHG
jgi:hypothetical protein